MVMMMATVTTPCARRSRAMLLPGMADSLPAFSPCRFGRYQLLQRLAVGGMAEIFRARDMSGSLDEPLVIKRMLPHLATDPEFVAMFVDEARLQHALPHPKIVRVFEHGEVDGQHYIALELVDGIDTLALLRACAQQRERLPAKLAVYITCEILEALAFAHTRIGTDGKPLGLVHRDISPSNIFLSRRGQVKLGDFGIARAAERDRENKTQAGTLKGKYGYMAPEQVVGGAVDARADRFAVGIVLAEMLMGRRLFTAPNDLDVLLMVRDARLDRWHRYGHDVPVPLRTLVEKLLQRNPDERLRTALAAREALIRAFDGQNLRGSPRDLALLVQKHAVSDDADGAALPSADGNEIISESNAEAERRMAEVRRAAAEPAVVQRAQEIATGQFEAAEPSFAKVPAAEAEAAVAALGERPDLAGDLARVSAVRVLSRLATTRDTGLLTLEHGPSTKEIYLVEGVPEFVASNVPNERFGEYLVARGVISAGELSMALAVLPRFSGKLGDTLVGLSLLTPLEVFRHLTRQVRDKIIDLFSWSVGRYSFQRGRTNQREAFPLGLDAFEIVGAGVAGLPLEVVRERLLPLADKRARKVERARPTPEHFRVGAGPRELWSRLDGKRTVGDWMHRYEQPEQLLTLCRTLFLLIETDLVLLD